MDFVYAILAVLIGAVVLLAGYRFARILIPIWGFFAGLSWGAAAVSQLFGSGFFATATGIIVGLITGVILAVLAYFFYQLAVVILGAAVGWQLGAGLLGLIGIEPGFLTAVLGLILGVVLGLAVIVLNIPKLLLILLTALGGAATVIAGVLILFQQIPAAHAVWGALATIGNSVWWFLAFLVVAIVGMVVQYQTTRTYYLSTTEWSYQSRTPS